MHLNINHEWVETSCFAIDFKFQTSTHVNSCQSYCAQFDLTGTHRERKRNFILKIVILWLLVLHSTIYCPDGIPFFSQKIVASHTNLKSVSLNLLYSKIHLSENEEKVKYEELYKNSTGNT